MNSLACFAALAAAVCLAIVALVLPAPAAGGRVHAVTLTGLARMEVPIGWENVGLFPRTYANPDTAPRVIGYRATLQLSDTADFSNIVWSAPVALPDVALLTTPGGALTEVVPPFDGTLNFAGTSGFVALEVSNWVRVRASYFTTTNERHWRVVGQHFEDPDPDSDAPFGAIATGAAQIDVRPPRVNASLVLVNGQAQS